MNKRIAVVLFNLGGPDSLEAVQPFLRNLFSDPDIFKFPLAFITQKLFAELVSRRRAPAVQKNYAAIGGKSPLLEFSQKQADALLAELAREEPGTEFEAHVCMRYWHPMTAEVVNRLKQQGIQRVILLPLYPQFSTTTTGSSYNEFRRECTRQHYHPAMKLVQYWYEQPDYLDAIAGDIRKAADALPDSDPANIELLFSAHGLPQKIVDGGDPYEQHIRATVAAVQQRLNWPHTTLCYQSRVGPLKWLQPYTEDTIREKANAGAKQVLVYPIAFVSDHIETLQELALEYGEQAKQLGIPVYRVVPALNIHPGLIRALANEVRTALPHV